MDSPVADERIGQSIYTSNTFSKVAPGTRQPCWTTALTLEGRQICLEVHLGNSEVLVLQNILVSKNPIPTLQSVTCLG